MLSKDLYEARKAENDAVSQSFKDSGMFTEEALFLLRRNELMLELEFRGLILAEQLELDSIDFQLGIDDAHNNNGMTDDEFDEAIFMEIYDIYGDDL